MPAKAARCRRSDLRRSCPPTCAVRCTRRVPSACALGESKSWIGGVTPRCNVPIIIIITAHVAAIITLPPRRALRLHASHCSRAVYPAPHTCLVRDNIIRICKRYREVLVCKRGMFPLATKSSWTSACRCVHDLCMRATLSSRRPCPCARRGAALVCTHGGCTNETGWKSSTPAPIMVRMMACARAHVRVRAHTCACVPRRVCGFACVVHVRACARIYYDSVIVCMTLCVCACVRVRVCVLGNGA